MTLNWPTLPEGYQWDYDTELDNALLRVSIWNADKSTKMAALLLDETRALEVPNVEGEIQVMIDSVHQQLLNTIDLFEQMEIERKARESKLAAAKEVIDSLAGPRAKPAPIAAEVTKE